MRIRIIGTIVCAAVLAFIYVTSAEAEREQAAWGLALIAVMLLVTILETAITWSRRRSESKADVRSDP